MYLEQQLLYSCYSNIYFQSVLPAFKKSLSKFSKRHIEKKHIVELFKCENKIWKLVKGIGWFNIKLVFSIKVFIEWLLYSTFYFLACVFRIYFLIYSHK